MHIANTWRNTITYISCIPTRPTINKTCQYSIIIQITRHSVSAWTRSCHVISISSGPQLDDCHALEGLTLEELTLEELTLEELTLEELTLSHCAPRVYQKARD
jgi:hypothetical protein